MKENSPKTRPAALQSSGSRNTSSRGGFLMLAAAAAREFDTWREQTKAARENELLNGKACLSSRDQKMSSVENQPSIDRGLKMKIKRNKSGASKHEIVKHEQTNKDGSTTTQQTGSMVLEKAKQHILLSEKDKSPKSKGVHKKEKVVKQEKVGKDTGVSNGGSCSSFSNGLDSVLGPISMEPKPGDTAQSMKREITLPIDPYEFNAKVEDGIGIPMKKIKTEKMETASSPLQSVTQEMHQHDVATATSDVGVATEPDCLGPCEPGTSVNLEGIVWHETENGMLVVNVTWRGKTYVGTLLDATKHEWAPPRFNCDSPVSDFETRTPKGRGKRSRAAACTPIQDPRVNGGEGRKLRKGRRGSNIGTFQAPPSPAKSDISSVSTSSLKRKGRPMDIDLSDSAKPSKRSRSNSRGTPNAESPLPVLIECPEPNCNKKYKHINGLRYHQTHAHQFANADADEDTKDTDAMEDVEELPSRGKKKENSEPASASEKRKDSAASESTCSNEKTTKESASDSVSVTEKPQGKSSTSSETNKSDKSDGNRSKKDISPPASDAPAATVSVSKPTTCSSQIYQISSAPMAGLASLAMVTQASSPAVTNTVPARSSPVVTSIPITVTAVTSVPQPLGLKSETGKTDKNLDKSKSKSVTRPIVPAPSPQMITLSSNVNVTHSNLTPVTTHTQVSPQLKPIQPKPTIMGDPPNPALAELKEKKAKQKKKVREKDSGLAVSNNAGNGKIGKDDITKCERAGVIRAVPSPAKVQEGGARKEGTNSLDSGSGRPVPDSHSQRTSQIPSKGIDLSQSSSRMAQPPGVLKVNSPLQVSTPDSRKTPVTDDVQSPAYSDISDANESGSPQNESPQKQKEEVIISSAKKEESRIPPLTQTTDSNRPGMANYGMYPPYYGQSQYMVSSMSPQNMASQPQSSPSQSQKQVPPNPKKDSAAPASETKKVVPSAEEVKKPQEKERRPVEEKPEEAYPKSEMPSGNISQQQMQDYQIQHQKWVQHQMYALQALPPHAQYQYLAAYGYAIDPQYHMHMMTNDPQYRLQYERLIEEQKRMQEEHAKREADANKINEVRGQGVVIDASAKRSETVMPKHLPSSASQGSYDKSAEGGKIADRQSEKDLKELALREKQNENHQILKENIDLKAQMDKNRYGGEFDQYRGLKEKQAEDLRRYQMYQEQKRIEQKKNLELAKSVDHINRTPENLSAKTVPGSGSRLVPDGLKPKPDDHIIIKKEVIDPKTKDSHRVRDQSEIKNVSDGKISDEKLRTSSSDKMRTPDSSKSRMGFSSKSASPSTPTSSGLNVNPGNPGNRTPGSNSSYSSYMSSQYPPYMQSSPYSQQQPMGQYDQNHQQVYRSVNPAMLGYSGGYLHPSQLPYRVEADEKDVKLASLNNKGMHPQPSDTSESKVPRSEHGGPGTPGYGGVHKIHELSDKGRSTVSHRSSPVSQKAMESRSSPSTQATSSSGAFEKHRELSDSPPAQRHVHTHHHTHVVSGGYSPMYDSYSGGSNMSTIPHQYPAK